jgi:SAM-dependent methyltransferase
MTYQIFAHVYNELMDDEIFSKWQAYTETHLKQGASILELGCGNGQLGILLKIAGYDIEGLDLSEEMLSFARNRQQEADVYFPVFQGDMRHLSEFGTYDAVISFCDSLCYLQEKADMEKTFHEAYAHLNDGGQFLFDVFTTEHIERLDGYGYHDEIPGIVFMWDSFLGEVPHSIEHDLSFFVEQADGTYERQEELHKERTYPIADYLNMLEKAGFSNVEVTADFNEEVTGNNTRWFFKAEK